MPESVCKDWPGLPADQVEENLLPILKDDRSFAAAEPGLYNHHTCTNNIKLIE